MARLQQVNDTASTLGAEAPATQEYIVLATGDGAAKGYPESGDYIVRIGNGLEAGTYEYKRVTGRVTDTLSFTGGLSYTWPVGTPVWIAISATDFTELWAAIDLKMATADDAAAALTAAVQSGAITDDVVKAPTHDAVYEALALKAPANVAELQALLMSANLPENVSFVMDALLSEDEKFCALEAEDGLAAEEVNVGEGVYLSSADSKWHLWKADAESTSTPLAGLCILYASGDAQPIRVMFRGKIRSAQFPAFTVGADYCVSDATAGAILANASIAGDDHVVRIVGRAKTAEDLIVNISPEWTVLSE